MNLKVYQIIQAPEDRQRWTEIVQSLSGAGFFPGEHNLRYCLNRESLYNVEEGIYVGALHEEYIPDQTSVTEEQEETPIENIDPWERTIFAIDFVHQKLLIQQRDYSPRNLSRPRTRSRITNILGEIWEELLHSEFNYIATNLTLGNDYFINNFIRNTRVLGVKLTFGNAWLVDQIYDGTQMNAEWKNVWNEDASGLNELVLKANSEGDLNESPYFKLALSSPDVTIESVTYYDGQLDKPRTESRTQFDQIDVPDVTKRTEIIGAVHETLRAMTENRNKLRDLRAINLE